ncbi:MAG TPA: ABC transporter substrate-binding protein [Mycobacteriales bacterium]|nr:ABC transporter substrate-binding protein [Mycobacteriales bacterium]
MIPALSGHRGLLRLRRHSRPAAVAAIAALALVVAGCSSSKNTGGTTEDGLTVINLSNTVIVGDEVPLVYANATNLWKQFGLKVNMINVTSSAQFSGLGSGQADIALGGAAGIAAAQKGAPVKIIGSIGRVRMDFLAQEEIKSVEDLRGKTLGASSPGSLLGAGQQLYLKEHGLNYPGDYKIVYTSGSFPAVITALVNKQTQANFAAHPYIDIATKGNPTLHALDRIDKTDLGIITANVATVNTKWAATHKDAVTKFFQVWAEASKQVKTHLKETAGYLASAAKITPEIATIWVNDQAALDGFAPFSEDDFAITIRALSISNPAVSSATFAKSVDNTYADAAVAST